ncbi:hypothetical protein [Amycolatopsis sp. cmx-4-68]|uniref:hypothetical protein n=1 Tax=Amycolatopsis sp. cmx-4-68 TaxID=2790938 RepID=UPI00397C64B3
MRIHFIVHESFEGPGAIQRWACVKGHVVNWSRLFAGDPLPSSVVLDRLVHDHSSDRLARAASTGRATTAGE